MKLKRSKKYKLTLTYHEMMFLVEWVGKYKCQSEYDFGALLPEHKPIPLGVQFKLDEAVYGREKAIQFIDDMFEHQPELMLAVYDLRKRAT
jgi:hypothetical protein